MPQISRHPLSKPIQEKISIIFLQTVISLKNKQSADHLISDLLTPTEKTMISKRLSIAYMLEKKVSYRTICSTLKVSLGTVSRINNTLKISGDGYRKILHKMLKQEEVKAFFNQLDYKINTLMPPKGKSWKRWRKLQEEKIRLQPF